MTRFNFEIHFANFRQWGHSNMSSKNIQAETFSEFKDQLIKFCDDKGLTFISRLQMDDSGELMLPDQKSITVQQLCMADIEGSEHLFVSKFG